MNTDPILYNIEYHAAHKSDTAPAPDWHNSPRYVTPTVTPEYTPRQVNDWELKAHLLALAF